MVRLDKEFFCRDTVIVAQELLGALLVHELLDGQRLVGRIIETEAYGTSHDLASHTARGKTARTAALFGPPGCAYVYLNYGIHECFNTVAHPSDVEAGGVLIRAVEPLEGIEVMQKFRGAHVNVKNLTNGPGKVGQAFAISRAQHYGIDLTDLSSRLYLVRTGEAVCFEATPRIGITKNVDALWRFIIKT